MGNELQKPRENNYDLLRIISSISVIVIHINYLYFEKWAYGSTDHFYYCVESILNIITRFSVPAFVMLSGAFILSNEENRDFIYFYKKMGYRIFLPTIVLLVVFFIYDEIEALLTNQSVLFPIKAIVTGSYYNLWYLYMLAGLYLLVPFIIRVKESVGSGTFKLVGYLFLLWAVISSATSHFRLAYDIGVVFGFLSYFIVGNIIYEEEKKKVSKPGCGILTFIMLVMIIVTFLARKCGVHYYLFNAYINFFSPTISIYAICMFHLFSRIEIKRKFVFLSENTFYIYLFHTWIYVTLFKFCDLFQNEIVSIVTAVAVTFFLSLILAHLYQRLWRLVDQKLQAKDKWDWHLH